MHTLATLVHPGTLGDPANQLLVGRLVANTGFLGALLQYGTFDRYWFFLGEDHGREALQSQVEKLAPELREKVAFLNLLELPAALAKGEISVIHQYSPVDDLGAIFRLRDRYATQTIPVTGQIHSLSYPSMMLQYLKILLVGPSKSDAIFCSSTAGRDALSACYSSLAQSLERAGRTTEDLAWSLPVVPLGIHTEDARGGSRDAARATFGIPPNAFVALSIARFTEYDKMDLFPLVKAFADFRASTSEDRPAVLLLAGARQGTRTPEMVQVWAKALGMEEALILRVDFPEEEKSQLLAAADCFVAASDNPQETFGISVVEAMAAGLPLLTSDLDGYKDTVSEEVGIRVPTHWNADMEFLSELGPLLYERPLHLFLGQGIEVDLKALQAGFEQLYSDAALCARLAEAARLRADTHYDWSVVIPAYEAHWRRLCEAPFSGDDQADPFSMDFHRVFGHYTTTVRNRDRQVQRSDLSRRICEPENRYPIYPELKRVFVSSHVEAAVRMAEASTTLGALETQLEQALFPGESWRASLLASWLIKHGLIEDAS